jgi:hypothetical protein
MEKGYYRHLLIGQEFGLCGLLSWNHILWGRLQSVYEPAQFLERYEVNKCKVFCNKQELFDHCMDDVNVLRQACCVFRNLCMKLIEMDPFRQAIIKSSIWNKVFLTMFLKPDTVSIIPREGFRMVRHRSVEALQWLAYIGWTRKMLLMPLMEGRFICLRFRMWRLTCMCREEGSLWVPWVFFGMVSIYAQSI